MFFHDINQVRKYVDVNASFAFELLEPKLLQAQRDVLKLFFGSDFIDELQAAYATTTGGVLTTLTIAEQKAIVHLRTVSALFAYAYYLTPGQVQVDSSGIFVAKGEGRGVAWEWQINKLIDSYITPGYQAIEDAILFLQKNISDYNTYENSEEFEYSKLCFVPTAKEFTKFYTPLNNSFMSYLKMRSCMDEVDEMDIKAVLLPDYYEELKSKIRTNTLAVADKAIIPYIKKAIVTLTAYKAFNVLGASFDENGFMVFDNTSGLKPGKSNKAAGDAAINRAQDSLSRSGETYLSELKKFLIANIVSYPTFAADPKYVVDQSTTFNNEDGQSYYAVI